MNLTNDNLSKKQIKKEKLQLQREQQARALFKRLRRTHNWIIIDTETTGIDLQAEIIEIAIINSRRKVLFNSLVKPVHPISEESTQIHGISNEQVAHAPTWKQIEKKIRPILFSKKILAYNAGGEFRFFRQTYRVWQMKYPYYQMECLCNAYQFLLRSKKQFSLEEAVGYKIKHRALSDCFAAWDLIRKVRL